MTRYSAQLRRWVQVFASISILGGLLSGCNGKSAPPVISITVSPSGAVSIDQGQTKGVTASVSNDTASKGVTWTVSGASCGGNACGTLTNATATAVTYNAPAAVAANLVVTVTGTSLSDATKSASVTITVTPAPAVSTASLAAGTVGVAYSVTLQQTGGVAPYTWSITSGMLPAGLNLNAGTGAITGM